jgi:hypothetical protein
MFLLSVSIMYRRGRRHTSSSERTFDPDDVRNVKYTRLGVWHLYEERNPRLQHIPGSSYLQSYLEMLSSLPYVWRMIKDLGSVSTLWPLLCIYVVIEVVASLIPAVSLWYINLPPSDVA